MLRFDKYKLYKKFLFRTKHKKYKFLACLHICRLNYRFKLYKNNLNNSLSYCTRPRNKLVNFIDKYTYIIFLITFNSLMPLQIKYNKNFYLNLFIEIIGYYLYIFRWNRLNINLISKYNTFKYLYRYLVHSYYKLYKKIIYINYIKIYINESYSILRKKKYPRRKRRFKRAI